MVPPVEGPSLEKKEKISGSKMFAIIKTAMYIVSL